MHNANNCNKMRIFHLNSWELTEEKTVTYGNQKAMIYAEKSFYPKMNVNPKVFGWKASQLRHQKTQIWYKQPFFITI